MKRLTYEEMQSAITAAGLSFKPWTCEGEMRERVESVLLAAAEAKGRSCPPCGSALHTLA